MGQGWSKHTWLCLISACVLLACDDDKPASSTDGGEIDSGRDATTNVGMDSGRDASMVDTTTRWIATRTALDVWWQGQGTRLNVQHDPGRDEIEIHTLTRVSGPCGRADSEATIKVCGIVWPPFTDDISCDAYQITVPESAWDSPQMPRFTAQPADNIVAGEASMTAIAQIGIALGEGMAWPPPTTTNTLSCEAGAGTDCFPDHDNDTLPGVTAYYRTDGAFYVGPYGAGRCSNDVRYRWRGSRTQIDTYEGTGPRADRVHLGIGTTLGLSAVTDACDGAQIDAASARLNLRSVGCAIDPTTIWHPNDPRLTSMDYGCTAFEAQNLDAYFLPEYRVLRAGERPGESLRPLGWEITGRDIDKRVSEGTHTESVVLDVDDIDAGDDGEPSCAQVRAVFAND